MKIRVKAPLKLSAVIAVAISAPSMAATDIDLGFARGGTNWFPSGLTMNADTYTEMIFCTDASREVAVSGFMSRPGDIRDPYGWGNTKADADESLAQVAFSIDLTTGGAKNPSNITRVEALHTARCGTATAGGLYIYMWPGDTKTLVMDDTGSMSEELEALKVAAQDAIVNPPPINIGREYAYSLLTFKDGVSTPVPITTDVAQFVAGVDALSASGGGDCPEASDQALLAALDGLEHDTERAGSIILVTDASPLADNRAQVIAKAAALNTPVDILLTGTCSAAASALATQSQGASAKQTAAPIDAESYFREIAQATGGTFKYAPGGTVDEYSKILSDMTFERSYGFKALNPGYHLIQGSRGSMSYYKVSIPAGHSSLEVRALSGTGKVSIYMSRNSFPGQSHSDWVGNNNNGTGATGMTVYNPQAGDYYIGVFGRTDYNGKRLVLEIR